MASVVSAEEKIRIEALKVAATLRTVGLYSGSDNSVIASAKRFEEFIRSGQ